MTKQSKLFLRASRQKAKDLAHRQKMNHALKQSDDAFEKGKALFSNLELARDWANAIKRQTIARLDTYLCEFERNFTQRGGKVIWAQTPDDAIDEMKAICKKHGATTVEKSKSMVTAENNLNVALAAVEMEVIEIDQGKDVTPLTGEETYKNAS